jgi:hypothetical protein
MLLTVSSIILEKYPSIMHRKTRNAPYEVLNRAYKERIVAEFEASGSVHSFP